jgi:tripartite-type tricarboxylate transporter receptor subunit TctC
MILLHFDDKMQIEKRAVSADWQTAMFKLLPPIILIARMLIVSAILTAALALMAGQPRPAAAAADYPTRPITLVVPYDAGGGNDVIARLVAGKMSANLGEPIVVENRGGAGSLIGTRYVAKSKPDGYTLLIATSALAINPALYADAGYDPQKDFAPVGLIATSANVVLVRPSLPVRSVRELIALAKQQPGKLDFASTGTGTSTHLAAELFASMAGVKMTAIPYKGVAPAVTDLLGGHVDLMFCPTASVVGLVKDQKLRALAVTGAKRSSQFPQLPTLAETGLPGYAAELHYGIVAPSGTPVPIIARLNAALNGALATADVQNRLAVDGAQTLAGTPAAYAADIAGEQTKWSAIIKKSGLKAE